MEDILEIYRRPYDPMRPLVCMDESTKQLLEEIRLPIPGRIGAPQRYDSEYRRNGVASLFLAFEPLVGWRQVQVTEQRTRRDWAHFIKGLLDERYPDCDGRESTIRYFASERRKLRADTPHQPEREIDAAQCRR